LIGFVFLSGVGWKIGVNLFEIRGCVDFELFGIGFVLRDWPTTAETAEIAERIG